VFVGIYILNLLTRAFLITCSLVHVVTMERNFHPSFIVQSLCPALSQCLLARNLPAGGDGVRVQRILEGEQESSSNDALSDLGADA
jgi:hypothetical protein